MKDTIDLFLAYKFLKNLVVPFEKWPAYKLGIIDKDGVVLIPRRERFDARQKEAFGYFDLITLNLKKLLQKLPGGKSAIASYAAAYLLLKEYPKKKQIKENHIDQQELEQQFYQCLEEVEAYFAEDSAMPVNAVGGGAIAGIGIGPDGEPPVTQQIQMMRRKRFKDFSKLEVQEGNKDWNAVVGSPDPVKKRQLQHALTSIHKAYGPLAPAKSPPPSGVNSNYWTKGAERRYNKK